jgi:hypothetical protein
MNSSQLFNAVVDQMLPFLRKEDEFCEAATVTGEVPTPLIADYGVDLPLIGKFLVHSWVDNALITEKVGKSDHAGVPTHLWDQWIVQDLNIPIRVLNTMRKWLFKRYCRGLMQSLGVFLSCCHGKDWVLKLLALRQEQFRTKDGARAKQDKSYEMGQDSFESPREPRV